MPTRTGEWTWFDALQAAASRAGMELPPCETTGMNTSAWRCEKNPRRVTIRFALRRRLPGEPPHITLSFWPENDELPPVAMIEETRAPSEARADRYLRLIRQWLVEQVSEQELVGEVGSDQSPLLGEFLAAMPARGGG